MALNPVPTRLVVMGVAGCGKSSLGAGLAQRLGLPLIEGDDHHSPASRAKMSEGIALTDGLAVAPHLGFQQKTVLGQVMPFEHLRHLHFQLIGANIGEKAQAATVDAQHRHLMPRQGAGGAEHAAIAADHDHQITYLAENLA